MLSLSGDGNFSFVSVCLCTSPVFLVPLSSLSGYGNGLGSYPGAGYGSYPGAGRGESLFGLSVLPTHFSVSSHITAELSDSGLVTETLTLETRKALTATRLIVPSLSLY